MRNIPLLAMLLFSGVASAQSSPQVGPAPYPPLASASVPGILDLGAHTWTGLGTFNGGAAATRLQLGTSNVNMAGAPSTSTSFEYNTAQAFGTLFQPLPAYYYKSNVDNATTTGSLELADDFETTLLIGTSSFGNRNVVRGRCQITGPTYSSSRAADSCVGGIFDTIVSAGAYGTGMGNQNQDGSYSVSGFGVNALVRLIGAKNVHAAHGLETDISVDSDSTGVERVLGNTVVELANHATQGFIVDAAFSVAGKGSSGWRSIYAVGLEDTPWPVDSVWGTVWNVIPRQYGAVETQGALFGMDGRVLTIAAGGDAIAMPNFGLDGSGNVFTASLNTTNVIAAKTATITSLRLRPNISTAGGVTGGIYTAPTTVTIAAPPAGGTTATAHVATYALNKFVGFGCTGANYAANDVIQVLANGGTGPTLPRIKVLTVDTNGGICTEQISIPTPGAMTTLPNLLPGQPSYTTNISGAGTGIGAGFTMSYTTVSPFTSLTTAGSAAAALAVTGKNFHVGNVLTCVGGVGTPCQMTVSAVDATGGILAAPMTTPGSYTTLPAQPVSMTGGDGTGASFVLGFSIATTVIDNPGSNYACAAPAVTFGQSTILTATALANITCSDAPLNLTGSMVSLNGTLFAASATTDTTNASNITSGTLPAAQLPVTGGNGSGAVQTISFQPGLLTAVTNTKGVFGKFVKASTVSNIETSAVLFTCAANPTITLYECGADASCGTPTTIGSATLTAGGQVFDGTISSATIAAGHYVAWAISSGTCASLDVAATAQIAAN